jgi:arylsulfatase A-like enzyme
MSRVILPVTRALLVAALSCATIGGCSARYGTASESRGVPGPATDRARSSLIVVVIDTLRRDHLGCYGYAKPTSPKLDAFAKEAALFEHCTAASSWTEPSTASLLSGLYPARHGAHEYDKVPAAVEMLAETLKKEGWRTFGVSGNLNVSPTFGFDQGFDRFEGPSGDHAREYPDVAELVAKAEELIGGGEAASATAPFFLYLHVMNVHGPYLAPPEWRERFLDQPAADFPFQNELWVDLLRKGDVARRADVTPAHLNDLRARYDGAIAYTDSVLGAFLDRRRAAGGGQDLVVVTSDHGEELFDHGGFGHGFTLHHELIDVPLLIRRPGGEGGGTRVPPPVSLVDLPATLLELLGVATESKHGDGLSLVPLLHGGSIERDAPIVAQLARPKQGVAFLVQRWPLRVIETEHDYAGRADVFELYDLSSDPCEQHDLAAADPERTQSLRRALRARRAELESQGLSAEKPPLDEKSKEALQALGY